jgi:hypothetical protein
MCPERQILSVYFDQELPSPWKEKMEKHLADCPACRARLESYRQISARVNPRAGGAGMPSGAVQERVWRRLTCAPGDDSRRTSGRKIPEYGGGFWRRSVSIPLPAAAAAAAAVFLFLILGIVFAVRPAETPDLRNMAMGIEGNLQGIEPVADMTDLLQYLGREDQGDIVIIRLPESRNFMSAGEPTIIKAADYSRRGTAR